MTNVYQLLTTATETASGNGDVLTSILSYAPLVLVIIAFYFLLIETGSDRSKIRITKWAVSQNITAAEAKNKDKA